jgi:hypothetical protein
MGKNRDAPTAEEVSAASGADIETARRALLAVQFTDNTDE